jgi:environmental stress-induced protein Ves
MKFLSQTDYKIMPWKNGGGTTTEIAIYPENTDISGGAFIWRVSIADVASNGPFSRFPAYDRHIMLIAGNGMILDSGSEGKIFLDELYKPASFSGDWLIEGTLKAGPVRDFNFIAARNAVKTSSLHGQNLTDRSTFEAQAGNVIIHALKGELLAAGRVVAETESVILTQGERLDVSPLSNEAILAVAKIALK